MDLAVLARSDSGLDGSLTEGAEIEPGRPLPGCGRSHPNIHPRPGTWRENHIERRDQLRERKLGCGGFSGPGSGTGKSIGAAGGELKSDFLLRGDDFIQFAM